MREAFACGSCFSSTSLRVLKKSHVLIIFTSRSVNNCFSIITQVIIRPTVFYFILLQLVIICFFFKNKNLSVAFLKISAYNKYSAIAELLQKAKEKF